MTKRAHSELAVEQDIPWQVVLPILVECLATGYSSIGQLALVCKSWHYAYGSPELVGDYFERAKLTTDKARVGTVFGNHRAVGLRFVQNFLADWFVLGSYGTAGNALLDQLLPRLARLGRPEFLVRMLHRAEQQQQLDESDVDALFQRVYEIVIRSRNAQLFHEIRVRFKLRAYHPGVAMLAGLEAQDVVTRAVGREAQLGRAIGGGPAVTREDRGLLTPTIGALTEDRDAPLL